MDPPHARGPRSAARGAGGVRRLRPHGAARGPPGGDGRRLLSALAGRRPRAHHAAAARVHRHRRPRPPRLSAVVALRLEPGGLPAPGQPVRIALSVPEGTDAVLRGDRFAGEDREYEGPSFGDWPHYAALKIEYDGDYRIPLSLPLASAGTESFVRLRSGALERVRGVHRIRIVVPATDEGWLEWESAPAPSTAALAFAAYSGTRGDAALSVGGAPVLRFPLGARADFDVTDGAWRLCHRAEAPRQDRAYGAYVLMGTSPAPGRPLALRAEYRAGLSQDPMFFVIDRRPSSDGLLRAARACGVTGAVEDGAARVVDARHNNYPEDTGRWTVAAVY